MSFDEEGYLEANPDVAKGVGSGLWLSGFHHYAASGRSEGRKADFSFDEALYLRRYADVARGIQRGAVRSATDHFLRYGWKEGRVTEPAPSEHKRIMAACCSLGQKCEFGVIQSIFDVQSQDLTRWADLLLPSLISLLENRLRDVGNPRYLQAGEGRDQEWEVTNTKYDIAWHTYLGVRGIPRDAVIKREAARVPWLAKRFLKDLQSASRLYVRDGHADGEEAGAQIIQLLHRYNPRNRLLWVRLADDRNPPGRVIQISDSLSVGYLNEFWQTADINFWASLHRARAGWLSLCQAALETGK